jgi:hypothetical protein
MFGGVPRTTPLTVGLGAAGLLAVLLVGAQLALPALAEDRVAGELEDFGARPEVHVSAFPAVKLLWGRADRVEVRMPRARADGSARLADELERTKDADELDVRVARLEVGPLILRDARLVKDGDVLRATAVVRDADIRSALPSFLNLRPAARQDGDGMLLEGSASFLGATIRGTARVRAADGAVVVAPENIPFGDLATVTVFSDPRVQVTSVGASVRPGGYLLRAAGRIVG